MLWNFVLSSALLLQKFVVALGLGGLLPGEMRSSCPIGVAGSTAHQQLAAPCTVAVDWQGQGRELQWSAVHSLVDCASVSSFRVSPFHLPVGAGCLQR